MLVKINMFRGEPVTVGMAVRQDTAGRSVVLIPTEAYIPRVTIRPSNVVHVTTVEVDENDPAWAKAIAEGFVVAASEADTRTDIITSIVHAIDRLDPDVADNRTASGKPAVEALERELGYDITAAQRDTAWAAYQAQA